MSLCYPFIAFIISLNQKLCATGHHYTHTKNSVELSRLLVYACVRGNIFLKGNMCCSASAYAFACKANRLYM